MARGTLQGHSTRLLFKKPKEGLTQYDLEEYFKQSLQITAFADLWLEEKSTFLESPAE